MGTKFLMISSTLDEAKDIYAMIMAYARSKPVKFRYYYDHGKKICFITPCDDTHVSDVYNDLGFVTKIETISRRNLNNNFRDSKKFIGKRRWKSVV